MKCAKPDNVRLLRSLSPGGLFKDFEGVVNRLKPSLSDETVINFLVHLIKS